MNDLLTIVFVNFYSEKKIIDYLKYFNNNFKIIIIDNANDLNLKDKLKEFSILKIINNKENIGFGAALNQGLEIVNTKYAMHLDIDTKFEISSINKMIAEAEKIKDFAILGPKISTYTYKNNHFIKKKSIILSDGIISIHIRLKLTEKLVSLNIDIFCSFR